MSNASQNAPFDSTAGGIPEAIPPVFRVSAARHLIHRYFCPWCVLRFLGTEAVDLFSGHPGALLDVLLRFSKTQEPQEYWSRMPGCPGCMGILPYCANSGLGEKLLQQILGSGFEFDSYLLNITVPPACMIRDVAVLHELLGCGCEQCPVHSPDSGAEPDEDLAKQKHAPSEFSYRIPVTRLDEGGEVISVKKASKFILGPYLTPRLGRPVNYLSPFRCLVYLHVNAPNPELPQSYFDSLPSSQRKCHRSLKRRGVDNSQILQAEFQRICKNRRGDHRLLIDEILRGEFPLRENDWEKKVYYDSELDRDPIYIAGRYIKLQRGIAQTGEPLAVGDGNCARESEEQGDCLIRQRILDTDGQPEASEGSGGSEGADAPVQPGRGQSAREARERRRQYEEDDGPSHQTYTSVAALLMPHFKKLGCCVGTVFHTAGREDIDVRMCGNGRPFIIELQQSLNGLSRDWMGLAASLNRDPEICKYVKIADDSLVAFEKHEKEALAALASGSSDKIKHYRAVCWTSVEVTEAVFDALRSIKNLKIAQRTPIRVMHRRSLLTREKTIYEAKPVRALDSHYFVIDIVAQAGTYIKEFVHGDLGRTIPSLQSILAEFVRESNRREGQQLASYDAVDPRQTVTQESEHRLLPSPEGVMCEILQLDVTEVDMQWPPKF